MTNNSYILRHGSLVLLATMTMLASGCSKESKNVPDVIDLSHRSDLDPELAEMVQRQIEVVKAEPGNARQRAVLGMIFEANELWSEARISYVNATSLDSSEPMWPHHAAIAWQQTPDREGAVSWLRKHTKRFPRFAPLQYRLGTALLDSGDVSGAESAFSELMKLAPNVPHGYLGKGDAYLRSGRAEEAAALFEKAVALQPSYKPSHYLLGRAYRELGRVEEAQKALTMGAQGAVQHISDDWSAQQARYTIGTAAQKQRAAELLRAGQYDPARQVLEKVVATDPHDIDALLNLGTAYLHLGGLQQARTTFEKAGELDDERFEIYVNLSACSRRMRQFDEALRFADQAVSLAPEMAATHYARGTTLLVMKQNERAIESLKTALNYNAQAPLIHQDLANAYSRLRRYDEAISHFQSLSKLLPNRWEPHLGLAKVFFLAGMLDEAREQVERGLKMAPDEPRLLGLAQQLQASGG